MASEEVMRRYYGMAAQIETPEKAEAAPETVEAVLEAEVPEETRTAPETPETRIKGKGKRGY